MKMLREWDGTSNDVILAVLKQFGVKAKAVQLSKYEAITPDSFIWCFTITRGNKHTTYYLYAEDFISSKDEVLDAINQNLADWTPNDEIELVPVIKQIEWSKAEPVQAADVYDPPEKPAELMKYAGQSGYDFVFLAKVIN